MRNPLQSYSVRDMLVIAAMAGTGLAVKPVVLTVTHAVSAPLMLPGGALAGGLYMMWLVMAVGLTGKRGSATLCGLIQAVLVLITGLLGSHGLLSLVSYTLPGLAADFGLLLMRHRCCCRLCCFAACMLANIAGTAVVNLIFFSMPLIPFLLTLFVSAFSGGIGGLLAWELLRALKKYGIGGHAYAGRA